MFKRFKIDIDAKDIFKGLDLAKRDMSKIARRMMGKVAVEIKKDVKNKNLKGGVLQKRSGNLLKSLKHKTYPNFEAIISSVSPYAPSHELGATILPKKGDYLTFKIDEQWVKVKQVILPKRPFLLPVIEDFFAFSKAEKIMENILEIALNEIMHN